MSLKTLFVASALAATRVAAIPISLVPVEVNTCVGAPAGREFTLKLASNVQYAVTCGRDYYGSDLPGDRGLKWPGSFEGCLAACDEDADCKAVSWTDGPCYLKGGIPELRAGNDAVWTAKKNPPPTCEGAVNSNGAAYISAAGNFDIECGVDYDGNNLPGVTTDSFAACVDHCAANNECAGVSFVAPNACYPKSALTTASTRSWVWTAKFTGTRPSPSPSADASPSATDASGTSPTPAAPKALSCINGASNGDSYNNFKVECGVDYFGGDIGAVDHTTTFEECMDACEANEKCIIVSWVWGSCYMKGEKNAGMPVEHVWGAVRAERVVASSSAVESVAATSTLSEAATTPTPTATESLASDIETITLSEAVETLTPTLSADSTPVETVTPTASADATPSEVVDVVSPTLSPSEAAATLSEAAISTPTEVVETVSATPTPSGATQPPSIRAFKPAQSLAMHRGTISQAVDRHITLTLGVETWSGFPSSQSSAGIEGASCP